ncbi:MAG: hypothetical protein LBG59_05945 [Candidatus Peribacteria bacterium]|jgi:hypothetical protein|nr:hypothetical protein [Candidatus Peribacteria bacterium]
METVYDISLRTAFPSFSFLHKDDQNALQTQTELSLALLSSSKTLQ